MLGDEFERLQREVSRGGRTVMDSYGATNPAEFFAVATECFFEKPREMVRNHPQLYEELRSFYRQEPAKWIAPTRSEGLTTTPRK